MKKYLFLIVLALLPAISYSQLSIDATQSITATLPFEGSAASGSYDIIYGNPGNSMIKPFILVEGWDPLDEQNFLNFYFDSDLYEALLSELNNAGYDLIFLNFDVSGDFIQRNAYLLVELIQEINGLKQIAGSTESNTVMGYSMGGVISRYALSYMEANDLDHETLNFISHDSPQTGANIPLSLQLLATDSFWHIVTRPTIARFYNDNPAVKQILIYDALESYANQWEPSPGQLFNSFHSELYNLNPDNHGYPILTKNIAISNGNKWMSNQRSLNGLSSRRLRSGDDIVVVDAILTEIIDGVFVPYDYIGKADFGDWIESQGSSLVNFPSGITGYDVASGSFGRSFQINVVDVENMLPIHSVSEFKIEPFCFIPTLSALNINNEDIIMSSFGINTELYLENGLLRLREVNCNTPFDVVFAELENSPHVSLSADAKDFILDELGLNSNYTGFAQYEDYSSTSLVVNASDFEHTMAISDVSLSGNVTVNSGGSLKITAGETIRLGPGFHAKSGSKFQAITGGDWELHDISCITNPSRAMATSSVFGVEKEVIDYGQYVSIYSNPNSGSFTIEIDYDLELVKQIKIANNYQEFVYSNENPQKINYVNINNPKTGSHYVLVVIDGHVISKQILIE